MRPFTLLVSWGGGGFLDFGDLTRGIGRLFKAMLWDVCIFYTEQKCLKNEFRSLRCFTDYEAPCKENLISS